MKKIFSYLDGTRGTELVECAFCNLGEYPGHGVLSVFGFLFGHGQNVGAVLRELAAQEEVHEVDLTDDVDQVQELAKDEFHGVVLKSKITFAARFPIK